MRKQTLIHLAVLPIVIFTLQSCFTAKNYVRPEIPDANYFRTDEMPEDSSSIAELSWKKIFTDPYLVEYIEEGLQNNIDIRIAIEQINAAEAYYRQGKAAWFPTLNLSAQAAFQQPSDNGATPGIDNVSQFTLSGTLSWEADIWGKIRSGERATRAAFLQSRAAHQAVKSNLIAGIADLYFRLLSLDEQIKVTEQSVANRKQSVETTKALMESGFITAAGVEQTKAQLYTAQSILVDLKLSEKLTEHTLSILLGRAPQDIERSSLEEQQINVEIDTGFPSQLLSNRPDVIAAEYGLINAFELTNVARANLYPSFSISASGGLQSLELDDLFSVKSWFTNTVGSVVQPLLFGRQLRSQYEVAKSREEIAYLNFKRAILTASREVSDAMHSLEAAGERAEIIKLQYEALQRATDYSEELLNNGMVNYLEVITARENALNAQLNLINSRFEQLSSQTELYRALGGGW